MDLITPELRSAIYRQFPIGSQEKHGEHAKVLVKYFYPLGRYTFYVTEGAPKRDDFVFFGYGISPFGPDCDEWGYTTLGELTSVRLYGFAMERDLSLPFATRTVADLVGSAVHASPPTPIDVTTRRPT